MTITGFLLLVLVGAICGAVAEFIVGWSRGGFLVATAVGFLGAAIGGFFAPRIGLPSLLNVQIEGHSIEIFWSVLGAIVLLMVMSIFRRSSYYRRPVF
jgi:uncharacterized membrane protein YeaQ/YmgE (transglycosylase-associated protein family)